MVETEKDKRLFDFFKDHSPNFLEMAFHRDYHERIKEPDGYGRESNECGDTVEFFLVVRDKTISSISLSINGCINTNACSNAVAFMVEGKTVSQAWEITPKKVNDYLGTLPPEEIHCAELAVTALRRSLINFLELKREPWKKLYA
ncbi:MAG: iron-sulfur cluster assembly scaffold protein [Deltaproteobacteria bacterium]|nr:iron-sulfur cluster assembly scaffold protein [Deltaproteobacteria bacterium]